MDTSDMTLLADLTDEEEVELAERATDYLVEFPWCGEVKESFLAFSCADIVGVFFFRIVPAKRGGAESMWVVVGDLPPAFFACNADTPDWYCVLQVYIREMGRWVKAARSGGSLKGIIPVDVEPTRENSEMLASRLGFLQDHFIDDKPFEEFEEDES